MENSDLKISGIIRQLIKWGYFTEQQIKDRAKFYGYKCWICKHRKMHAFDHVIPNAYKVIDFVSNLRPVCRSCNSVKRSIFPFDIQKLRTRAEQLIALESNT